MMKAPLGDDVMMEDPTVNRFEAVMAERLNKPAALFLPTGTMSNLCALLAHCNERGAEIISGSDSHITTYEAGGCATLGGIHNRQALEDTDGMIALADIKGMLRVDDVHHPTSAVVCLENTHNIRGGIPLSAAYVEEVGQLCRANGVRLHIDGARVFNAAVAFGVGVDEICAGADSVSVCLSKGLGAPMGSVLVGSEELIYLARRARKALGGGMRQAGVVAAAGMHALDEEEGGASSSSSTSSGRVEGGGHVQRLAVDHELATNLGQRLQAAGYELPHGPVRTNIIYFKPPPGSPVSVDALPGFVKDEFGVLCGGGYGGGSLIRVATHRDVEGGGIERAAQAFEAALLAKRAKGQ